jgi:hypothetical protein
MMYHRLIESMNAEEMESEIALGGIEFDAEFFHQHFGQDDEGETRIKGYKDLSMNLWIHAQTYHMWLDIQYSKKKMGADKLEKVRILNDGTSDSLTMEQL